MGLTSNHYKTFRNIILKINLCVIIPRNIDPSISYFEMYFFHLLSMKTLVVNQWDTKCTEFRESAAYTLKVCDAQRRQIIN